MKKNVIIGVLAAICLALIGYIFMTRSKLQVIDAQTAKTQTESFINKNLLSPGQTATINSVSDENGMYKMSLSLSTGQKADSYLTKDGKLFFPQAIDVAQVTQQSAAQPTNPQTTPPPTASSTNDSNATADLKTQVIKPGTGTRVVKSGDTVTVDYTGTLTNGQTFDTSIGKTPFTFTVGKGDVIQGWDEGLLGTKVGEEIKLTVPPELGYGANGAGSSIPPNATLIFDVKVISIK